jgi:hypothetical protein
MSSVYWEESSVLRANNVRSKNVTRAGLTISQEKKNMKAIILVGYVYSTSTDIIHHALRLHKMEYP